MFGEEFIINNYAALMEKLNEFSNMGNDGALIVLEVNPHDYVLSQIVHLVEQNNATVLHVFSYLEEKTSKQIVILKIDLGDASSVLRSFERFNYSVRYYLQKQVFNDETLRNRLGELMYYLEM
ncbi:MAG: hypothetical protein LBP72_04505 [Dysgonamonadaceae bacterium]|jgi:Holliday junction resolvasome RuvABC DNA-binding subunit|nr:hypothetical protein [Dysgonamonadaceae bacterium]